MKKVLGIVLVLVLVLGLSACASGDYKKAEELYGQGKWAEAREVFEGLKDYKDSSDRVLDCRYQEATELLNRKSYSEAAKILEELGSYQDSKELLKKCCYSMAESLFEEKKYEEAAAAWAKAGDWQDSAEKQAQALVAQADALVEKDGLSAAVAFLEKQENIPACAEKLAEVRADYASALLKKKDFEEALAQYELLNDKKGIYAAKYGMAGKLEADGKTEEALVIYDELGDYEDCLKKAKQLHFALEAGELFGIWTVEADNTDEFLASMDESSGMELSPYFSDMKLIFNTSLEIKNDGTATVSVDADDLANFLDEMESKMQVAMLDVFRKSVEAELAGTGYGWNDLLRELGATDVKEVWQASVGMSIEEFVAAFRESMEESLSEVTANGTASLEEGRLVLQFNEVSSELNYEVKDDTLTFLSYVGEELFGTGYPVTFTRQK